MCIPKQDLNLIINNKNLSVSFSGTIAKFVKNKTYIHSIRGIRYHGPTKMSFLKLIRHSFLIISIFIKATVVLVFKNFYYFLIINHYVVST